MPRRGPLPKGHAARARGPSGGPVKPARRRPKGMKGGDAPPPLPTREQLRAFLREAPGRVGKSDIARHFGLTSDQRPALRELLRSLKESGQAQPTGRRGVAAPGRLPDLTVV